MLCDMTLPFRHGSIEIVAAEPPFPPTPITYPPVLPHYVWVTGTCMTCGARSTTPIPLTDDTLRYKADSMMRWMCER